MNGDLHIHLMGRPREGWGFVCHIDGRILAVAEVGEHAHAGKALVEALEAVKALQAAGRVQQEQEREGEA